MKKYLNLTGLIIFCSFNFSYAQNSSSGTVYKTWIYLNKTPEKIPGIFYQVKDSSIIIANNIAVNSKNNLDHSRKIELNISDIDRIYIRKKHNKTRGALIGAFAGFVVGFGIGYAQGDDPPCSTNNSGFFFYTPPCNSSSAQTKGLMAGIPGAFAGAGLGIAIGSIKIKIPINGEMENYRANKEKLSRFSLN